MANFLTYQNLYEHLGKVIKAQKGSKDTLIKIIINQVYLNEIITCDDLHPLFWLVDFDDSLAAKAPADVSAVTAANPGVATATAHGLVEDDIISFHNFSQMTELNGRVLKVGTVPNANSFQFEELDGSAGIDCSGYDAETSGGTVHHRGLTLATSDRPVESLLRAQWHDELEMVISEHQSIEELQSNWDDSTGRPTECWHRKHFTSAGAQTDQLIWFPGADQAYDLRLWQTSRVDRLSADADVPILPYQFHDAIIAGAATRLAESNVQVESPSVWPQLYRMALDAIRDYNRQYWMTASPDKKPFMM
jgi:hypothetical protein